MLNLRSKVSPVVQSTVYRLPVYAGENTAWCVISNSTLKAVPISSQLSASLGTTSYHAGQVSTATVLPISDELVFLLDL